MAVILLLVVGCGQNPAIVSATNPNESAVEKCRQNGADDDYIDTAFTLIRTMKNDGFTSSQALGATGQGCPQDVYLDCVGCFAAIIDEVYGL